MHLIKMKLDNVQKSISERQGLCLIGINELKLILKETRERINFLNKKLRKNPNCKHKETIKRELKELRALKKNLREVVGELAQ